MVSLSRSARPKGPADAAVAAATDALAAAAEREPGCAALLERCQHLSHAASCISKLYTHAATSCSALLRSDSS